MGTTDMSTEEAEVVAVILEKGEVFRLRRGAVLKRSLSPMLEALIRADAVFIVRSVDEELRLYGVEGFVVGRHSRWFYIGWDVVEKFGVV